MTCDAQWLSQRMFGDTIAANICMMGFAWQRGLIPLSLAALTQAIELNGIAVAMNRAAFALGRLASADPDATLALIAPDEEQSPPHDDLDALVAHRETFLAAYQDAAYAQRYRALVERVRKAEAAIDPSLAVTRAVASAYAKLMAYKDEYEVARLFTDGEFRRRLDAQFEGDYRLEFHMAPPLFAKPGPRGEAPKKLRFGAWMMPLLALMAKGRRLRGTAFDPFGRLLDRRVERALIADYERMIDAASTHLGRDAATVASLAALPEQLRGYGHVKVASLKRMKRRERELLATLGIEAATSDVVARALEPGRASATRETIPIARVR